MASNGHDPDKEDILSRLRRDSRWLAASPTDGARQARRQRLTLAEAPLVADLRLAGCAVTSVWDLVNQSTKYHKSVVPTLLEHLAREYPPEIRAGIARALAVPEARIAWDQIVTAYKRETERLVKEGLGVAVAAIAGRERLGELIALVLERRNGPSRVLFLQPISRSRDPRAVEVLRESEADPELCREAAAILRRRQK